MPLFYFKCSKPDCGTERSIIGPPAAAKKVVVCKLCGSNMTRAPRPPSSKAVEVLDNGLMSRKVERIADADRIFKERSKLKPDREP